MKKTELTETHIFKKRNKKAKKKRMLSRMSGTGCLFSGPTHKDTGCLDYV
jgi:hypothetical protein